MLMSPWLVLGVIAALCWFVLLLLPWRPWSTREQLEPNAAEAATAVQADQFLALSEAITVLIPARDEAEGIERTLYALKAQAPGLRILVIDDESSDDTATLAAAAGAVVIAGRAPPPGWTGKLWALEQGRAYVNTEWILQIDADIQLAPGMLAALLRQQAEGVPELSYDLVSIMALLPVTGFWQRLLLPAYVWFFKLIYPFHLANGPQPWAAAAAGGCILIRRDLLERIGGYGALRHAVIDDCTLAAACKRAGGRTWVGLSRSVLSHRASTSLRELADLVARTAYTQLRHSLFLLFLASALLVLSFWVPLLTLLGPSQPPLIRGLGALAWGLMGLAYLPLLRFYRLNPVWVATLPITASLYLWMTWLSAWRHWRGYGAQWKGRSYLDQQMKSASVSLSDNPTPSSNLERAKSSQEPTPETVTSAEVPALDVVSEDARRCPALGEQVARPPVFIIGSPRSGTSVLHWSLLQHAALWGSEESDFMLPITQALKSSYHFGTRFGEHAWLLREEVSYHEYCAFVGLGIDQLYRQRSSGRAWVEQTPAYSLVVDELALMFPFARFLFIHRDGRKVNESMRRMWQWDVARAAHTWVEHNEKCLDLAQNYPQRVHSVAYESLVADPEAEFRAIFSFLSLDYAPAATAFLRDRQPINVAPGTEAEIAADKLQLRSRDWDPQGLEQFWQVAGLMMPHLGYPGPPASQDQAAS